MTISLEKKLQEATVAKKRYQSLLFVAALAFILVVSVVYNKTVFDYAVLDNVAISRVDGTNKIIFKYDVITSGRIDFIYGDAILTDRKEVQNNEGFEWSWTAQGATEIKIRSRKLFFPHWDAQTFIF